MALNRFRAAGVCILVHSDTIIIFCWVSAFGQGIGVLMVALWSAKTGAGKRRQRTIVNHFSDDIAIMYLGHIVEKVPAKELFNNPLQPKSYMDRNI